MKFDTCITINTTHPLIRGLNWWLSVYLTKDRMNLVEVSKTCNHGNFNSSTPVLTDSGYVYEMSLRVVMWSVYWSCDSHSGLYRHRYINCMQIYIINKRIYMYQFSSKYSTSFNILSSVRRCCFLELMRYTLRNIYHPVPTCKRVRS